MNELIRTKADGSIGFGDYTLPEKTKLSDYQFDGASYKVKTFKEMTRLEKNEMFLYESEPGTSVEDLKAEGDKVTFTVEGNGATQITLGLEDNAEYKVSVDGVNMGKMTTNLGGKLSLSAELTPGAPQAIVIERV